MKQCEGRSDGGMCIIDNQTHIHLDAHEASAFWQWLSTLQQTLHAVNQHTQRALQLLQAYQIEAYVHPLLEDSTTYAQG